MTRSATSYGQYHVAEAPASLLSVHLHAGAPLKEVDWEPKIDVLDQEDLFAQGIDTSKIVKGATRVDALGSCTANATTAALSNVLGESAYLDLLKATDYTDVKTAEEWAILFYHLCSDLTGDSSQEWPPTDCGSSGPYIVKELQALKLVSGNKIASGVDNVISLMQTGGLIVGMPFYNAFETPDRHGFIDGDGSSSAIQSALDSGLAGGHEIHFSAIEKIALTATGKVIPEKTVIRVRNSWAKGWGDNGSYRAHMSTYAAIGGQCDFRQLQPI